MRPGPNVFNSTAIPPTSLPTNTGTWFAVGAASQGPVSPTLLTSFAQYQKIFGGRGTYAATISDCVEQFFLEGGASLVFCRATGASAKTAEIELKDSAAAATLKVAALGPGTYANKWKIVVAGTESAYTISVETEGGEVLEISPTLTSRAEAITWSKSSSYVTVAAAGSSVKSPAAESVEIAGGTDESESIATGQYEAALNKFTPQWGPGQLSVPGVVTTAVQEALFKIAKTQRRRAVVDLKNGSTKAELITAATTIRGLGETAQPGALYASWQQVNPLAGTVTTRVVPLSPFVAAKAAVIDSLGNPNVPVAGKQAILNTLNQETNFTETEVEELYAAGVNVTKNVNGQIRIYGNRTPVNPSKEPLYLQFSNARLDMAIIWKGAVIEETFMFSQLDGEGNDTTAYGNALKGMMLELYKVGAVFGGTPQEAFSVDAGSDVNTPASEAEGNLNATIAVRRSPGADQVNLNIVRVGITQEV